MVTHKMDQRGSNYVHVKCCFVLWSLSMTSWKYYVVDEHSTCV